ncbi:MAG TPA: hypothetical protein VGB19_05255 [Actinomycetota bacterium]
MAKNKKRKRGWSGAPTRPQGLQRAGQAGPTRAGTGTASEVTEAGAGDGRPAPSPTKVRPVGRAGDTRGPVAASGTAGPGTTAPAGPNRIARKEEARRQREMLRRKAARRRRMRLFGLVVAGLVVVGGIIALIVANGGGGPTKLPNPRSLPGINVGPAPWPPETAHLADRDKLIGLPPLGQEVTEVHFHQNLLVYVHGQREPVPFGVGQDQAAGTLAEIHTHDATGTIHIEAAADRDFNLQMVFDVWGVLLTKNQVGMYRNNGENTIRVFVNGRQYTGDFTRLPLEDKQVIVVTYGTQAEVPDPMPAIFRYSKDPLPSPSSAPTGTPSTTPSAASPSGSAPAPSESAAAPSASPS